MFVTPGAWLALLNTVTEYQYNFVKILFMDLYQFSYIDNCIRKSLLLFEVCWSLAYLPKVRDLKVN